MDKIKTGDNVTVAFEGAVTRELGNGWVEVRVADMRFQIPTRESSVQVGTKP